MKPLLFAVLCTFYLTAHSTDYYLSPAGNDNNAGTITSPFFSLNKAWNVIKAGDIVYLRGGTYSFPKMQYLQLKNGTPGNLIKIWAYPGETPILTRNYTPDPNNQDLIYFEGNYIHFKGFEIANSSQKPGEVPWSAFRAGFANNCIWENINYHHNAAAMQIRGNSSNNLILNCDFHHNQDPYGSNGSGLDAFDGADGFAFNNVTGTNNTIRGCRSYWNADDGFDLWDNNGYVLIENSWSFWNGYVPGTFNTAGNGSGFKLGLTNPHTTELLRTVQNCVAHKNRSFGIAENQTDCKSNIFNNTISQSGVYGFWFGVWNTTAVATLKNNISYTDKSNQYGAQVVFQTNSWQNGLSATAADFVSTDDSQLDDTRQADGSLPDITFLHLAASSKLKDAGANVGLSFTGTGPDIGAFETGGAAPPPPANQSPVANAGTDKNIILPTNSVSITGTATDPDGTIASYNWTKQSGGAATLAGAATNTLNLSALVAGNYVFRLTVTDDKGATGFDEVTLIVNSNTILPPPPSSANIINVSNTVQDAGFSYYVSQDFGTLPDINSNPARSVLRIFENGIELLPPHSSHSDIQNIGRGRFSHWSDGSFVALYFSASDNSNPKTNGRTYTYSITSAVTNLAPVANAGADKTITLPVNNTSITGSGSDPDGTIASYTWSLRSGPNTPSLSGSNTTALSASGMIAGTYVFRLTVTDNKGLTAFDEVTIVVNSAAVIPPSTNVINVSRAVKDAGFSYYVSQNFGTLADISSNPTRSVLRIFENGVELLPPHSSHSDIQNIGRGRFSHWSDGSFVALYFSASDNSNPKTNGRTYTYSITPK
jgi:hypothetical protein